MIKINKKDKRIVRNKVKEEKLKFTINELNKLKIKYQLKNIKTGQINIKTKIGLIVYYSNTDRILINNHSIEKRGLIQLIKIIQL